MLTIEDITPKIIIVNKLGINKEHEIEALIQVLKDAQEEGATKVMYEETGDGREGLYHWLVAIRQETPEEVILTQIKLKELELERLKKKLAELNKL